MKQMYFVRIIVAVFILLSPKSFIYAQSNVLDTTFGDKGKQLIDIGYNTKSNGNATAIAFQTDHKILVGATVNNGENADLGVVRYNSNGSIDSSFGTAGQVVIRVSFQSSEFLKSIGIQSDGKIILGGYIYAEQSFDPDFLLMRLLQDGTIDKTFGIAGKVIVNVEGADLAEKVLIQQDDKIILAGTSFNKFAAIRVTENGVLDPLFNGGIVTIPLEDNQILATALLQTDGKIILTGTANNFQERDPSGTIYPFYNNFLVVRLTTTGLLDNSFDSDGIKIVSLGDDPGSDDKANSAALSADGKIIVAGSSSNNVTNSDFAIIRLSQSGTLDSTFNGIGMKQFHYGSPISKDFINRIEYQNNDKIVFLATSDSQSLVSRLLNDGDLDATFGNAGVVNFPSLVEPPLTVVPEFSVMELQPNFMIVLAGADTIARLTEIGDFDTEFNGDGERDFSIYSSVDKANAIATLPDGKIIMAGISQDRFPLNALVVIKVNKDGSLDESFGNNGRFIMPDSIDFDEIKYLEIQADGKIIFSSLLGFGRLTSQGRLDSTYGENGIVNLNSSVNDIEIQPDGKLLVLSEQFLVYKILRFDVDGNIDPTFESTLAVPGLRMTRQADGKIVVATIADNDYVITRILTNGLVDEQFGKMGITIIDSDYRQGFIEKITMQNDSKILLAGYYEDFSGSKLFISRLKNTGILDSTFNDDGINIIGIEGDPNSNSVATDILEDNDGSIVIAGFSDMSIKNILIARLTNAGVLDDSFTPGGIALFPYSTTNYSRSNYFVRLAVVCEDRLWVSATSEGDFLLMKIVNDGVITSIINSTNLSSNTILYPNPSNGVSYLQVKSEQFSVLKIYSARGEFILQKPINGKEEKIDLSGYPKGMYFVKISGEQNSESSKIVIE